MAGTRAHFGKLIEALKDGIAEAIGSLAPQPDAVPVPVRNDPRHAPRR